MSDTDPLPNPPPSDPPAGSVGSPPDPAPLPPQEARPSGLWVWGLSLGLLAGLGAWSAGEAAYRWFRPSDEFAARVAKLGTGEGTDLRIEFARQSQVAESKNVATAHGLLGAVLGLALGLAGGLSQGRVGRGLAAGLLGLVLGGLAGAGVAFGLMPTYRARLGAGPDDLLFSLLMLGSMWGPVGLAAGLALGLGIGRGGSPWLGAVGGLVGAVVGTLLYVMIGAAALPSLQTDRPLPESWAARLFSLLMIAVAVSAGAVAGVSPRSRGASPPRPPQG